MQSYASTLDYEARIMIRSLFNETKQCTLPINPAHYAGRYAFKSVSFLLTFSKLDQTDAAVSNMLTISFGTRTDTASDPLVEKALAMAMEFMDLTGIVFLPAYVGSPLISIFRAMVKHHRLYRTPSMDTNPHEVQGNETP